MIGSCVAAEATTDVLYECYDCTYYKGPMELNPQCNDAENMDNVAKKSDCKFCKVRLKAMNLGMIKTLWKRILEQPNYPGQITVM